MTAITLRPLSAEDLATLGPRWQALERRGDPSFFQTWHWVGCLAEERYPNPILLEAVRAGETVALALFNCRPSRLAPRTLWLGESGLPALDTVYVEHNGPLVARDEAALLPALLRGLLAAGGRAERFSRRVVLSGVPDAVRDAGATVGVTRVAQTQPAPVIDLGTDWMAALSANTRHQLRRSARRFAEGGPLALRRAATSAEARAFLAELAALHQAAWTGRGMPGAFANPSFGRFHDALIARAWDSGTIDLCRITAGEAVVGLLYNFRHRGRVLAYQSGFAPPPAGDGAAQRKAGLTCHHLAIEASRAAGMHHYDFLAGADRYKTSLAPAPPVQLHWMELAPRWSSRGIFLRVRDFRHALAPLRGGGDSDGVAAGEEQGFADRR